MKKKYKWFIANLLLRVLSPRVFNRLYNIYVFLFKNSPRNGAAFAVPPSRPEVQSSGMKNVHLNYGKRSELLPLLRREVRPLDGGTGTPLISIIVINRNGIHYLKKLIPSIIANTIYPNFEVILADNGSGDDSCAYIENQTAISCTVVRHGANLSFSEANNIAAAEAKGSYLVFLNNDTEVCYGWLTEAYRVFLSHGNAGCVGVTLVYAEINSLDKGGDWVSPGLSVQHTGCAFKNEGDFFRPYNLGAFRHPMYISKSPRPVPAVSAACQVWKKQVFEEIGGFDQEYIYGYEDVDICLKAISKGYEVIHCPTSVVLHHEFGTQKKIESQQKRTNRLNNINRFKTKWFDTLRTSYWKEKLSSPKKSYFGEFPLTIGIIVTEFRPDTIYGDCFTAQGLGRALERKGFRVVYLPRLPESEWEAIPENIDALLVLIDGFPLNKIKIRPGIIKIAWIRNWADRWCSQPWITDYDMILCSSKISQQYVDKHLNRSVFTGILEIGADTDIFKPLEPVGHFQSDICFVGNMFHLKRDISTNLELENEWKFRYWGRLEDDTHPFKLFHEGTIPYHEVPKIYNSSKIILEDCAPHCNPWGSVNSRTFEAMACGGCVVSNVVPDMDQDIKSGIFIYETKAQLKKILTRLMEDADFRAEAGKKARQVILDGHTYDHRAGALISHLFAYLDLRPEEDSRF